MSDDNGKMIEELKALNIPTVNEILAKYPTPAEKPPEAPPAEGATPNA